MAHPPPLGQYSTTPIYNTKAVARETEVPADTFRAWERRYGIPRPQRTAGRHRLYSERDIAIIRWLRDRTAEGMNISQAVMLLQNSLEAVPETQPALVAEPRGMERLNDDFVAALTNYDSAQAERILSEAFAIYPFEDVLLGLIQPTMIEIGELWFRGEINVATEHFCTEFVRRKLSGLINLFAGDPARGMIIMACAPDEQHDLGALIASLFMVRRGWQVVYLGPQVPLPDLLEAVRTLSPDLVCLSATMPDTATQLADVACAVLKAYPRVQVGYGGRIFNLHPELRQTMPGTFMGEDARSVTNTAALLLGRRTASAGAFQPYDPADGSRGEYE